MISFACLVPHPPILIPEIGKANAERLKKTQSSYRKLAQELKDSQASTILLISPHGQSLENAMLINQNVSYRADFSGFGYIGARESWAGNLGLAQAIASACRDNDSLRLYTQDALDHGAAVPLVLLTKNLGGRKIIPLSYSGQDLAAHFAFGRDIGRLLGASREKIAIVASGDLSHCLSKEAPAGYSPRGAKFDNRLKELIRNKNAGGILDLPADLVKDAAECGLKSAVILLGMLENADYEPRILSYEAPFGVGYLAVSFALAHSR